MEYIIFFGGFFGTIFSTFSGWRAAKNGARIGWVVMAFVSIIILIYSSCGQRTIRELSPSVLSPHTCITQQNPGGNILFHTMYNAESIGYVKIFYPPASQFVDWPPDNWGAEGYKIIKIDSIITDNPKLNDVSAQNGCEVSYQAKIFIFDPFYIQSLNNRRIEINHSEKNSILSAEYRFFGVNN